MTKPRHEKARQEARKRWAEVATREHAVRQSLRDKRCHALRLRLEKTTTKLK